MVSEGASVVDVGCDHAHTSIWLIQQGRAKKCIAMDLRKGPLAAAANNIKMCQCESSIETRLSDGLEKLTPGEADCILITGMGGTLVKSILEKGRTCMEAACELILQPQSELGIVREFIQKNGFYISEEKCCWDYGKFYISIHAKKGSEDTAYTPSELEYGRFLPRENPEMHDYLCEEYKRALSVKELLEQTDSEKAKERLESVLYNIELLNEAILKY